jgi:hypothetical protein
MEEVAKVSFMFILTGLLVGLMFGFTLQRGRY